MIYLIHDTSKKILQYIFKVLANPVGVCCCIVTAYTRHLILRMIHYICHEDMTGKSGGEYHRMNET